MGPALLPHTQDVAENYRDYLNKKKKTHKTCSRRHIAQKPLMSSPGFSHTCSTSCLPGPQARDRPGTAQCGGCRKAEELSRAGSVLRACPHGCPAGSAYTVRSWTSTVSLGFCGADQNRHQEADSTSPCWPRAGSRALPRAPGTGEENPRSGTGAE